MKVKRLLVAIMTITLIATGMIGNGTVAKADTGEASSIAISESNVDLVVVPGETKHIKLPIKAVGSYIMNPTVNIRTDDTPFTISPVILSLPNSSTAPTAILPSLTTYVEFDVTVKETATIGSYPITLEVAAINNELDSYTVTMDFDLQILEEKSPAQLTINDVNYEKAIIGCDTNLTFVVKNEGERKALNAYVSLEYSEDSGIIPNYATQNIKIGDVAADGHHIVSLPISVLPTASSGMKKLSVNFEYKDDNGTLLTESYDVYITVTTNNSAPYLQIENVSFAGELKPEQDFDVIVTLNNTGDTSAKNVFAKIKDESISTDSFIKNYYSDSTYSGDIKSDEDLEIKIPLTVSKQATGGLKELAIEITYTDEAGVVYTAAATVFPEVIADTATSDETLNIVIGNVKQSLAKPLAGEKLEVSFDLENTSQLDITKLKIKTVNLVGDTFIPIESEPYQYIEVLEGESKKRITIPLIVSNSISEGLNYLTIKCDYAGGSDEVDIPIHDVQNDLGSSSKPKLIVSNYYADAEELRAGETFNLTFDLYNTNFSVAAKNITVTVTQEENVFSVTQGSNSFFINSISPGETVENTLELKVKSDATTKAYPIEITIDYEYDGAEPNSLTGEVGETKVEKLNLQAVENSRPVVDYVNVYSWDGSVIVNNSATLSFEFYNMGKSSLNNVIATVEGDFTKADGNMYFIGNVMAGNSMYAEFDVIPNVEGISSGVLRVTFEDSNGDEVEFTKEFETMVQGETAWDSGMDGGDYEDAFNPILPEAKKAIIPLWLFIVMQVVVFAAFIPITRKIIIGVYKGKLRKKEEENY